MKSTSAWQLCHLHWGTTGPPGPGINLCALMSTHQAQGNCLAKTVEIKKHTWKRLMICASSSHVWAWCHPWEYSHMGHLPAHGVNSNTSWAPHCQWLCRAWSCAHPAHQEPLKSFAQVCTSYTKLLHYLDWFMVECRMQCVLPVDESSPCTPRHHQSCLSELIKCVTQVASICTACMQKNVVNVPEL